MSNVLNQAIRKWGYDMQQAVAIEEMSELTKELCKYKRGAQNFNQIAEEIADVEIMMEQLKIMFDCHRQVEFYREDKIKRLAERIKNK